MKNPTKVDLTGEETFVMDFSKPGEPEIYIIPPTEILLCEGKEDCILIEKKVL